MVRKSRAEMMPVMMNHQFHCTDNDNGNGNDKANDNLLMVLVVIDTDNDKEQLSWFKVGKPFPSTQASQGSEARVCQEPPC